MYTFGKFKGSVVIFQLFVIGFFIVPGSGLRCYICDSSKNPGCIDLKRSSGIEPEPCKLERMVSSENWLTQLYKVSYYPTTHYEQYEYKGPMHCQKVVASKDGDTVTSRFCQIGTAKTDPCQISFDKLKNDPSIKVESCSICDTDGCNSAPKLITGISTMFLALMIKLLY
ncbi:unnamed protein product [Hermetia illucens]|uniref:Protein sleepless n=1 Tax=Hermetia illucens TaxID=343691 RepID=A0A7R8UFD8_HERIL|nr:uncharacterized protein LOC119657620 [Hermetia illucens]CAD7079813.1 unnamed protein product [Hermetia illucens]